MFTRFSNYIKETRQELYKVNWPTRAQAIQSTLIVIFVSIGVALFLGAFDYLFAALLRQIIF
ncbi:MAG: preprotein translocase subunit SecE [Candidatus Ryanbacteria bacterium]|nr:preprotein translocase subunit SecE [Candidatus Ryanbacteria bacterium]